ncbi:hypothetical protein CL628_04565 [bacterium]|nr:hypothetical protein [bacterium]
MDNQENSNPTPTPPSTEPESASAPPAAPSPPAGQASEPARPPAYVPPNEHKGLSIIGYIFPVLFFLPLVTEAKHDPAAKFHSNQQLILLIWFVIANFIGIIPLLGWIIAPLMWIFGVIVAIMGIINAAQGAQKRLPLIGKYDLIK